MICNPLCIIPTVYQKIMEKGDAEMAEDVTAQYVGQYGIQEGELQKEIADDARRDFKRTSR